MAIPAKKLRQDHARVSSGTQQHAARQLVGNIGKRFGGYTVDRCSTALHRQAHIISRVTVGNGKYIEIVDDLCIGA